MTTWRHNALAKGAHSKRIGWAWMFPGEVSRTIAERITGRFVADLEVPGRDTPEGERWAYWTGRPREAGDAAFIAQHALGVTSHGFPKTRMLPALRAFAEAGLPVFPQVYDRIDSDETAEDDAAFLRKCVSMHTDLGFAQIVPILNLARGPVVVRAQLAECQRLGLPWHLWRMGLWSPAFDFVREYLPTAAPAVVPPEPDPLPAERSYTGPETAEAPEVDAS